MTTNPPNDPESHRPTAGSTRSRDPEATRAAILGAAERLFLAKGYANTTMSEIAEAASVGKSLIYHHFDSKDRLWEEVKAATMREYIEAQRALFAGEKDTALVRESVVAYFRFLRRRPEILRLNAWLELEGPHASHPKIDELTAEAGKLLRNLQRSGVLRDDVDPAYLMMMLVGLAEFWLANRKRVSQAIMVLHGQAPEPECRAPVIDWETEDERYIAGMVDVLLRGLHPES